MSPFPAGSVDQLALPFGVFSSQLDSEETKSGYANGGKFLPDPFGDYSPVEASEAFKACDTADGTLSAAQRYRHRRWLGERNRMHDAIWAATGDTSRCGRFLMCGDGAQVQVSEDGQFTRVTSMTCRDRFCEPCSEERAWHCKEKLMKIMRGVQTRFVTITLEGSTHSLSESLSWITESFGRLRNCKAWKSAVKGGAWFIEITRGAQGDHWHVHIHSVVHGTWLDKYELSEAWRLASGGSYIVHIRAITEEDSGAEYAAKYASKGIGRGVIVRPEDLQEAIIALRGRRLIGTFGDWWRTNLEEDEPEKRKFNDVGSLKSITTAALTGQPWAVAVMQALAVRVRIKGGVPVFTWRPHDT